MSLKRVAIYLGSFDPLTFGHLDVIERASNLFDKLIVGVGHNSSKECLFSSEDRFDMIKKECERFQNVEVKFLKGLAVEFAKDLSVSVLLRGLRSEADFAYEMKMAFINKTLLSNLETVFLPTKQKYSHLSSSLVKEVASYGGDISEFVPSAVLNKIKDHFS